jgi:hypothetical protein
MNQARFQKQQREKARRDKAAAKSARKEERRNSAADESLTTEPPSDQASVLDDLAQLHERFEAGEIPFEDFIEAKDELTRRLNVD